MTSQKRGWKHAAPWGPAYRRPALEARRGACPGRRTAGVPPIRAPRGLGRGAGAARILEVAQIKREALHAIAPDEA